MVDSEILERWNCEEAVELYGVREWSLGYFGVSEFGEVVVRPRGPGSNLEISLFSLVAGIKDRGMSLPVLLRFGDILRSRVTELNEAFGDSIKAAAYRGDYRGVYPIKVNQQQQVVEEVLRYGRPFHHGLEVGSKAELIAALGCVDDPEATIVCNGYKDDEYIRLVLLAQKMGLSPVIVIEKPGELPCIARWSADLGTRPHLGVRVKLSTRAGGMWTESGGDRSVFGLTSAGITSVLDELNRADMLDCLRMLHYHLGSQIPSIRSIRAAIREAGRFYVDLVREGAAMGMIDVGGGLAVDYDGSHTSFPSSRNYTLAEYCADIVEAIMSTADEAGIPHPTIISESGRATVSHHSVLLFNVLGMEPAGGTLALPDELPPDCHERLRDLWEVRAALNSKNAQECYHDATFYRDELRTMFLHDGVSLRERALGEEIFWDVAARIARGLTDQKYVPDELLKLPGAMADVYYCNFSVFQSLPDAWAIGQLFPIMPVHRLDEQPTREAILADITCDCDGKIDRFVDLHDVRRTLPLHAPNGSEYVLGAFLCGAYQETLGDLHNLLGDPNVVAVHVDDDGTPDFEREIEGDSVGDVLSYVRYDPRELIAQVRRRAEQAVKAGVLSATERRIVMDAYQSGMRGYTYFED